MIEAVTMPRTELQQLLVEAARLGANHAFDELTTYHLRDACKRLGVSYNTLAKRIKEGKIRPVDGRISGREIRRYLSQHVGDS
ncbi:hypothetical protein IMZ29_07275 [Achromobacter sp. GG226]|uniref:helix-turn-helix domain-containing protein n=1 Tax=Verticiella alkaliphila TaxID=2779529 RepID=UPI001C0CA814|nr:helix-turn-helix domain-containing protein [Verticiella sp. GG226]MBU4610349.1 hypothetical protein [Verticiella sp. GG226]